MKSTSKKRLVNGVIFVGALVNAVVIVLILYYYVF
jgi:hypothetical protein